MGTLDKFVGILVFAVALPLSILSGAHWSAVLLIGIAAAVFVLFIVPGKKERCGNCGYYYILTVYEGLFEKKRAKRCATCSSEAETSQSGMLAGE